MKYEPWMLNYAFVFWNSHSSFYSFYQQNHLFYFQLLTDLISHLDLNFNFSLLLVMMKKGRKKWNCKTPQDLKQHVHFHGLVKTKSWRYLHTPHCIWLNLWTDWVLDLEVADWDLGFCCVKEVNGNPLHFLCVGDSMDRGAWWAIVHMVARSQTFPSCYCGFF